FGPYRIDTRERILVCEGRPVPLALKAYQTLLVLVRESGHVVGRNRLMEEVWPDSFVEESNVTQNIFALRKALNEKARGAKYIETIARRGYRFIAEVHQIAEAESIVKEVSISPRTTHRYTESSEAYEAYLQGRVHWSHHTREGLLEAINCFRSAIDCDPNYALAYASIVDCYLRLATNYIPPRYKAADLSMASTFYGTDKTDVSPPRTEIRQEWDRRTAQR